MGTNKYWDSLGWDGYDDRDDVDTFEHLGKKVYSGFEYNTPSTPSTPKHKSSDFETTSSTVSGVQRYMYGCNIGYSPIPTPTDTFDANQLSIVLMRQDVLDAMANSCKVTAGGNEFQIHYRALIMKLQHMSATVYLTIPTAYYNFTQDVSGAAIDYELTDIDKEAAAVVDKSMIKIQELIDGMPIMSALKDAGYDVVDIYESNSGSMHRHPGRFGFSSVDYRKDPKHPGVVYRQGNCTNFLQTDSVLYLAPTRCEVYTTESRVITVAPSGAGVAGTYCRIPTVTFLYTGKEKVKDIFTEILGQTQSSTLGYETIVCSSNPNKNPQYELLSHILDAFASMEYNPDISGVDNSKIKSRLTYAFDDWDYGLQYTKRKKDLPIGETTKSIKEETTKNATTTTTTTNTRSPMEVIHRKVFGVDLSAWDRYLAEKSNDHVPV